MCRYNLEQEHPDPSLNTVSNYCKKLFPVRVVRPWRRLPREAVAAPSLAVFKARLDGALSNLVWWKVSLPRAGGLRLDDFMILQSI